MKPYMRAIIAYFATAVVVRLLYWLFKFSPTRDTSFGFGLIIDFVAWVLFFSVLYWGLGKFIREK